MRAKLLVVLTIAALLALLAVGQAKSMRAAPSDKVKVEFFVMSRCPDAAYCEAAYAPSLLALAPILDLSVDYIAQRGSNLTATNTTCMHGEPECVGNRQQLCAQLLSSAQPLSLQYLNFTTCQSASYRDVPNNAAACAKQSGFDLTQLQACVDSVGQQLLYESAAYSRQRNQSVSCTVLLDNDMWCVRDGGQWKQCSGGSDAGSFVTAVCNKYTGIDSPAVCKTGLAATASDDSAAESPMARLHRMREALKA